MPFVELNRYFAPLRKDQPAGFEVGRQWGRTLGGWLNWGDLLSRRRVVLLAEASSGKSEEFRNQQERLVAQGKTALSPVAPRTRKNKAPAPGEGAQFAQGCHGLPGEGDDMRGFGLGHGVAPFRRVQVDVRPFGLA
jgi:hypothetical protein